MIYKFTEMPKINILDIFNEYEKFISISSVTGVYFKNNKYISTMSKNKFEDKLEIEKNIVKLTLVGDYDKIDTYNFYKLNQNKRSYTDHKSRIVDYLVGSRCISVDKPLNYPCKLCKRTFETNEYLSDGTYVWPSTLSHYVGYHNVTIPDYFYSHMFKNNFKYEKVDHYNMTMDNTEWIRHCTDINYKTFKIDKWQHSIV